MASDWSRVTARDRWKLAVICLTSGFAFAASISSDVPWPVAGAVGLAFAASMAWMTPRYLLRDPDAVAGATNRRLSLWTLLLGAFLLVLNVWRAVSGDLDVFVAMGILTGAFLVIAWCSQLRGTSAQLRSLGRRDGRI